MNTKKSTGFKCFRGFVFFYLIFTCFLGICLSIFACWLILFRQSRRITKAKNIICCFLIIPAILSVICTALGWRAVKRKQKNFIKSFAVLLAVTDFLLVVGCIWTFASVPQIKEQTLEYVDQEFHKMFTDTASSNWWNDIQSMFKCCGINGPTDYYPYIKSVPFSCCGYDPDRHNQGSCSVIWQNGCANPVKSQVAEDMTLLGLIGLIAAFLQIPGIFIMWCFAKKLS